jgi:hypothetical protein
MLSGRRAAGGDVDRLETVRRMGRSLLRPPVRQRIVLALWLVVAAAIVLRLTVMLSSPLLPGDPWRGSGTDRYFLDFRDTIWTPGRYFLSGGNPYDPLTYQAAYPWALAFSLYAPVWLLLAGALAPLPYLASIVVFQVLSLVVAIVMLRVICRWTMQTIADLAVPAALLWMNVWYPGRGALSVQLTTLLAVLGTALVLRSVTQWAGGTDPLPSLTQRAHDRGVALGVALSLLKPQFGAMALVGIAGGRARSVWRGVAALALASLPVLIICTAAAGGPVEFVRAVLRDLAVANSPDHPSGLAFPDQRRLDLLGQLARYGLLDPPSWLQFGVLVMGVVVLPVLAIRLTRRPLPVAAVVCTAMLLGIYHGTYDLLVLFVPVAIGIGMALRRELTRAADRIAAGALLLVVLHLQTISKRLVPGLDVRGADTVNLVLILVGLTAGLWSAVADRRRVARRPGEDALSATGRIENAAAGGPTTI